MGDLSTGESMALLQAWRDAIKAIRDTPNFPEMVIVWDQEHLDEEPGRYVVEGLECPHCGKVTTTGVYVLDIEEQWTQPDEWDPELDGVGGAMRISYDYGSEREALCYISYCCRLPVSLPDAWEEVVS